MFKSWQIFVFSLIPLGLVFAGVIIGSMDGIDAEREVLERPSQVEETPVPLTPSEPGDTVITLIAEGILFDQDDLTATPGNVSVQMDNRDPGVPHNFSLYADRSGSQPVFVGDIVAGPTVITYEFEAPPPGAYFFRCDVHPDTMKGSFTVQ